MDDFGPIYGERREGKELFHCDGAPLSFNLLNFWQWSASDIVSNTMRGIVAEYLVACAIGIADGVREEWAACDLETPEGVRIEVKSAAYIQSWRQNRLSNIIFRCPKTHAWDKETNRQSDLVQRHADVYVFALLAHTDQRTLDPLNVSQWEFFVVPTVALDNRTRSRHSITLPSLKKLAGDAVSFQKLKHAIENAAKRQRELSRND